MTENNVIQSPPHRVRNALYGAGVLVGVFGLMQLARFVVPEFKLDNPPVTNVVNWDSPETQRLWNQTCGDCHSNETVYPWYSYVAPMGWLVAHDTQEGRRELNISENHRINVNKIISVIREGEMPPPIYTVIHRDANLSDADRQTLIEGLRATFGG
jgi:hypothetical protein